MTRRKYKHKPFPVTVYQRSALDFLLPPEDISVSQWAEEHRILDIKSSAMPGHWRNSVTPYLSEIMDTMNDYEIEETIFVKPTQVGGTEVILNRLGYLIAQDPGPTLIVYPTDTLGESTSDNRIQPMVKSSPAVKQHWNERISSKLEMQFDNMYVSISGANSPASLASKPIRYLFLDEVDKFPAASRREADPISLARERTKTFIPWTLGKRSHPARPRPMGCSLAPATSLVNGLRLKSLSCQFLQTPRSVSVGAAVTKASRNRRASAHLRHKSKQTKIIFKEDNTI